MIIAKPHCFDPEVLPLIDNTEKKFVTALAMTELIDSHVEHVRACKAHDCFRCLYLRNQQDWKKRLPWLVDRLWKGPSDELVWGLGCKLCINAGLSSSSNFSSCGFDGKCATNNFNNVMRHCKSKSHAKAMKILACGNDVEAPSPEQFAHFMTERLPSDLVPLFWGLRCLCCFLHCVLYCKTHWFQLGMKRTSLNFHMPGLGGRKKMTQMQRCVGLACEAIDLKFLKTAGSIVLHQDVSKGVLVVTFSACSETLELCRGFLGCQKLPPSDMDSLQKCTRDILRSACAGNQAFFNEVRSKVAACTLAFSQSYSKFIFYGTWVSIS